MLLLIVGRALYLCFLYIFYGKYRLNEVTRPMMELVIKIQHYGIFGIFYIICSNIDLGGFNMMDRCPICGKWHEFYHHDCAECWFESGNLDGAVDSTIIEEWETVSIPPAPDLKSVTVKPETSALLILDMETTLCQNLRCLNSIVNISLLLTKARQGDMLIVYSLTHNGVSSDIVSELAPSPQDPIVRSNVDKFYNTNLNTILQEYGIKTVLVTGYAANGAVLHTATAAAFRGYEVIVPVDGMSAKNPYAEQYTAWHMLNSPGTRNKTTLTKVKRIRIDC